jgi:membrane protease YdiL (CAAX protease family)
MNRDPPPGTLTIRVRLPIDEENEMKTLSETPAPQQVKRRPPHYRAPVRLLLFFLVLFGADLCGHPALVWVYRHSSAVRRDWAALGASIVVALGLLGIYGALVHTLEHRKANELAPGGVRALVGVGLGVALFTGMIALLYTAGVAQFHGVSRSYDAIPVVAAALVGAVGEELVFRGGVYRILEESCGTTVALGLSAAVFGLLHAFNPGATLMSATAIAVEAGLLLGAAYAVSRNIWLPIGLHFGWNFAESAVFGITTSSSANKGFFAVTIAGPGWLTGGPISPEGSVMAIVVCLSAALLLMTFIIRGRRWVPVRWGVSR